MKASGFTWTGLLSVFLVAGLAVSSFVIYRVLDRELEYKELGMRRSIRSAAFSVSDNLVYELYAAYSALRPEGPLPKESTRQEVMENFSASFGSFRESSRFPDLVTEIAFIEQYENGTVRFLSETEGEIGRPAWIDVPSGENAVSGRSDTADAGPAEDRGFSGGIRRERLSMDNPVIFYPGIFVRDKSVLSELVPVIRMDTGVIIRRIVPALTEQFLNSRNHDYDIDVFYKFRSMPSVGEFADLVIPLIPQATFETPMEYYGSRLRILHNAGIAPDLTPRQADRPWYTSDELHPVLPEDEGWFMAITLGHGGISSFILRERLKNACLSGGLFLVLAGSFLLILMTNRKARRLASREQEFVTLVSHELKTPLSVIRSVGENLETGIIRPGNETREYGRIIVEENRRLSAMVENILTISAVRNGMRKIRAAERVDWNLLIRSVVKSVETFTAEQGAVLEVFTRTGTVPLYGDRTALSSAVRNLVTNAIRHGKPVMGEHRITVSTDIVRKFGRKCNRLTVDDCGRGVPPGERKRIFRLFYRGERAGSEQTPGSGIGLSLARRIAKSHGGSLACSIGPAGGARFTMIIPGRKK